MTESSKFYLSEVPFAALLLNKCFFTSATGKPGIIATMELSGRGSGPEITLTIVWKDVEHPSVVVWPDECTKLEVNLDACGQYLQPYCNAQIALLNKHRQYYEAVGDGNPHSPGSLQWATHKETNTSFHHVVEELPSR